MRTERVFLMELFLDDELPKAIKIKIKERFQELEEAGTGLGQNIRIAMGQMESYESISPAISNQSPSTQRILMQNPDLIPKPPTPVTPQAAAALAQRQALINGAGKEKPEEGRRSPRKI